MSVTLRGKTVDNLTQIDKNRMPITIIILRFNASNLFSPRRFSASNSGKFQKVATIHRGGGAWQRRKIQIKSN